MDSTNPFARNEPLPDTPWPVAPKSLLSKREQGLYAMLQRLYPDHQIFIQVALSQLVDVPRDHPERKLIRSRFKQLVADFVLCRPDLSIIAVIELDDPTHRAPHRQAADARKTKAITDAGLRLVRIPEGPIPSTEDLRHAIESASTLRSDAASAASADPVPHLRLIDEESIPLDPRATDQAWQVHKGVWGGALRVVLLGALLVGGWYAFVHVMPYVVQTAMQPLAATPVIKTPPTPRSEAPPAAQRIPPPPVTVTPGPSKAELEVKRDADFAAAEALRKQKQLAWTTYFKPEASCDHPENWNAQVACGNQYIRAKQAFETQWARAHGGSAKESPIVIDNHSFEKSRR